MRIHDAINEWWVKAPSEALMVFDELENEDTAADGFVTTAASSLPVREVMDLVGELWRWRNPAHMWFLLLVKAFATLASSKNASFFFL